jgi:hypothetical protein
MADIKNALRLNDSKVVCKGCGLGFYHSDAVSIKTDIENNYYAECCFCGWHNPEKDFVKAVHPRAIKS